MHTDTQPLQYLDPQRFRESARGQRLLFGV
jgi:hypothetical protein